MHGGSPSHMPKHAHGGLHVEEVVVQQNGAEALASAASSRSQGVMNAMSSASSTGMMKMDIGETCLVCGSVFISDSVFCRKCGTRRVPAVEKFRSIWSWSQEFDLSETDRLHISLWGRLTRSLTQLLPCHSPPDEKKAFRILDRDGAFCQSLGNWNIRRVASQARGDIRKLYFRDLYHTFVDSASSFMQVLIFSGLYFVSFTFFACLFYVISDECNLKIEGNFGRAYYLSLETMATIGYGVPDPYFNDCWQGVFVLTSQCLVNYFLNAFVVGSVFLKVMRPQTRAHTIVFSDKAVIQEVNGAFYFMFQVCESKHHELVDSHIRCYCVWRSRTGRVLRSSPMRLQQPDDAQGAKLLLTLPTRVIHRIDQWSPLAPGFQERYRKPAPSEPRPDEEKGPALTPVKLSEPTRFEVQLRETDAETGNRDSVACGVCGDTFMSVEMLRRHTLYQAAQDADCEMPEELRHDAKLLASLPESKEARASMRTADDGTASTGTRPSIGTRPSCKGPSPALAVTKSGRPRVGRAELEHFFRACYVEVVVLLEGIEPTTSATLQARHSFLLSEDLQWDAEFVDCTLLGSDERACGVDLGRLHDLLQCEPLDQPDARDRTSVAVPRKTLRRTATGASAVAIGRKGTEDADEKGQMRDAHILPRQRWQAPDPPRRLASRCAWLSGLLSASPLGMPCRG